MTGAVAFETLGCKVNQYESSYFIEVLKDAGYRVVSFREPADVYIVHGCAVTGKAAFQTRQLLRRAHRLNPGASIVAAGCQAQLEPERIAGECLATHILGNRSKFELVSWLQAAGSLSHPARGICNMREVDIFMPRPITRAQDGRARALLKVQDGCDAFCSYCIVPYVRGAARSLPRDGVRAQLDRFLERGYREVILTGIHLGQWGRDLTPSQDLDALLMSLQGDRLPDRVRLSSLEPMEFTSTLLEHLSHWDWICPHFHVPLQSGDAEILKQMGRPYTPRQYAECIMELHRIFPGAALGADVLAGFPGETELQFAKTCELIDQLPLTYLHAFPFSPRPETPAAEMPGRLPAGELKRRVRLLREMSRQKRRAFQAGFIGHSVQVLAETRLDSDGWRGTSENYLQVVFPAAGALLPGFIAEVKLLDITEKGLLGKPVTLPF